MEKPAAQVIEDLAHNGGVLAVDVPLRHLLQLLSEEVVHEVGNVRAGVVFAVGVAVFELVNAPSDVEDQLLGEPHPTRTQFSIHFVQKQTECVLHVSRIDVSVPMLVFLAVFLPVLSGRLQICLFTGGESSPCRPLFLGEWEHRDEVLLQGLQIRNLILGFLSDVLIILGGALSIVLDGVALVEFGLPSMFGLDVGVEGRVAQVALATCAVVVAPLFVLAGSALLALLIDASVLVARGLSHINYRPPAFESPSMLTFIALSLSQPITNRQKYQQALQQIRHYVSLKDELQLDETDYVMSISRGDRSFSLVKEALYLHTNHYSHPLIHKHDYEFMDACYECLMVICEAFPSSVTIKIISESESNKLEAFQAAKREELNRRINSRLKTMTEQQQQLTYEDIEDIIVLIDERYTRKNKLTALKLLLNKLTPQNAADVGEECIETLQRLQQSEPDLRKLIVEIIVKMRSLRREGQEKQNRVGWSNVSQRSQSQTAGLTVEPVLIELRETYNIQRVCSLLKVALNSKQDTAFMLKLEGSVRRACQKFIDNQYEEMGVYGGQFLQLVRTYWRRINKKWDESSRVAAEARVRSLASSVRRSRMRSSKKFIQ